MPSDVVSYALDDSTIVSFEIDPAGNFRPAGRDEIIGRVRDAVGPAVEAAKVVLDRVREARPAEVEVRFGLKASGTASWLVAKAATEGNFEITLRWQSAPGAAPERDGASP